MSKFFDSKSEEKYCDLYGREIPTMVIGPKRELVCRLVDLQQTGVGIVQKSQYQKLARVEKDYGPDFVDAMLEAAKTYMLANKISFSHEQIMNSIENLKLKLGRFNLEKPQKERNCLNRNRTIESTSSEDIVIKVSNSSTPKTKPIQYLQKSPQTPTSSQIKFNQDFANKFPTKGFLNNTENTEQNKTPKQKFETDQEHDVIVTAIDRINCVWIRDLANNEYFQKIHEKVNEEAKFQKLATKPWVMDKVYMTKDDDNWFRCKIVKYNPLTVFFLDYGNVAEVNEIRDVSDELAKTPCMAVRITFKKYSKPIQLEDILHIKKMFKNEDGTIFVHILDQSNESLLNSTTTSSLKSVELNGDENWNDEIFKMKPPNLCKLEHNLKVAIISFKNDIFFLRTKNCFTKLTEIEKEIDNYVKDCKMIEKPEINQLVLYQDKNGKNYRAIITNITKNRVEIELLDYGDCIKVDLKSLKTINEKLSREPVTILKGDKLFGFENERFNELHKQFIQEAINERKKFSVSLGFDDEFDLFDGNELLSEQLKKLEKKSGRIFLKDIKTYKPEMGLKPYVCGYYKNSNDFALVSTAELKEYIQKIVISEVEDTNQYIPLQGEICLCFFVDAWYRAVITRIFENECEVLLLDFGNVELVKKDKIRKIPTELCDIPILAIPCVLTDLPNIPKIEEEIKKIIIDGEIYKAEIKRISDGKCQVIIPSIYEKL